MDDKYAEMLKETINYKVQREEKKKQIANDRLCKKIKKKIQTTMIGALDVIEKQFGFLWSHGDKEKVLTPEQEMIKSLYEEARAHILDKGNTQIRNLEIELNAYDIQAKKYTFNLPVVKGAEDE